MDASTAQWSWDNLPTHSDQSAAETQSSEPRPTESDHETDQPGNEIPTATEKGSAEQPHRQKADEDHRQENNGQQRRRRYGDRTCRICLDVVSPRFVGQNIGVVGGFMGEGSKPIYISPDDPSLGRLISPCKCKGSQRYVHEGCLDSWRKSARGGSTNYFSCPTCLYRYRLGRLTWARLLQSSITQISLTAIIFMLAVFVLGFFAEPIFRVWNDPVGTIADSVVSGLDDMHLFEYETPNMPLPDDGSWWEHFVKGFFSLGIIGFAKYLLAASPWHWWNLRSSGIMGPTVRRGGGRARAENISWALVVIGALSFIYTVWKAVRGISNYVLKIAGDNVLDVGGDEEDDD